MTYPDPTQLALTKPNGQVVLKKDSAAKLSDASLAPGRSQPWTTRARTSSSWNRSTTSSRTPSPRPLEGRVSKRAVDPKDVVLCPFIELSLNGRSQYSKERVTPWTNQIIDECLKETCNCKSYYRDLQTLVVSSCSQELAKLNKPFKYVPWQQKEAFYHDCPKAVTAFASGCYLHHHAKERCATSHWHCSALGHEDGWNFVRTSGDRHDGLLAGFPRLPHRHLSWKLFMRNEGAAFKICDESRSPKDGACLKGVTKLDRRIKGQA